MFCLLQKHPVQRRGYLRREEAAQVHLSQGTEEEHPKHKVWSDLCSKDRAGGTNNHETPTGCLGFVDFSLQPSPYIFNFPFAYFSLLSFSL